MSENNFFNSNRELLVFAVLTLLVLLIYWQTTGFGFINLDDNLYVYENPMVLGGLNQSSVKWALTSFFSANWHPLTWLSHMTDAALFGRNAGGHHAVNIVIHLVNSLLAFVVFRQMTGSFWKSAAIAALFAVHPAHVESVAWVSERKDVLSTLFWLLTMWAYLRYVEKARTGDEEKARIGEKENERKGTQEKNAETFDNEANPRKEATDDRALRLHGSASPFLLFSSPSYLLVVLLFALGLMAKPMLVTLPCVLLLIDYWSLERLKTLGDLPRLVIEKIPLFVLSGVSSVLTILAQRSSGAVESLEYLSVDTRVFNALVAYAKYVVMLFYPAGLAVWYPYERSIPAWQIVGSIALLASVTAFCLRQARRGRKYLLMGWLWFLGTLVPVIGLVQVGSQSLADRYTYIPYFGLFVMIVWGLDEFVKNKKILLAVLLVGLVLLSALSFRQTSFWKNNETLYRRALAVTENNFLVSHNLCYTLTLEDRLDEAEPLCRRTIELNPGFFEGYNTLGILQLKRGDYRAAEQSFKQVLEKAPGFSLAYANLSVAQSMQKKPEEAEANLEKAVRLNDGIVANEVWINALNNLAAAYNEQRKYDKAVENLTRILIIDQANAPARANLALTLNRLKRYDEAQKLIETAIQLNPNEAAAYNIYGLIMLEQNRTAEAAGLFQRALQLKPDYAEARENLRKAQGEK